MTQTEPGERRSAEPAAPAPAAPRTVRKDIQALRALAVAAVVVNHVWPRHLPGGYVGVDIFFVISGYLISNHLLAEVRRTGTVRLGSFYARRAKRLLPAALLVGLVALAAAYVWLPFNRWAVIAQETIAAAFYAENWVLAAKSVDYSAHSEGASTVQHYWSLSVEEQFYLLWPLLLLAAWALATRFRIRHHRSLTLAFSLVGAASFAFCVWYTMTDRSPAYFVTPGRAWEFAAGGLIAVVGHRLRERGAAPLPMSVRGILQTAGLGLLVVSALAFNETTLFPGYLAAVPVAGTALIIASGPQRPGWSPVRLLENRPVQYVGDISYSLYLWHWPLIILAPSALARDLGTADRLGIVVLSLLLAAVTKRFVEDPGRTRPLRSSSPRKVLLATVAAMSAVAIAGLSLTGAAAAEQTAQEHRAALLASGACFGAASLADPQGCADPFGPAEVANVGDSEAPWFNAPECSPAPNPVMAGQQRALLRCDFTQGRPASETVWLIGDSHAEQWKAAIHELARQRHWVLYESLVGGCPLVDAKRVAFMGVSSDNPGLQQKCLTWSRDLAARITAERPNLVIASTFGSGETIDDGTGRPQLDQYRSAVSRRFMPWAAAGSRVLVIRDTPLTLDHATPDCVAQSPDDPRRCSNPRSAALPPDPLAEGVRALHDRRLGVLDLSDQFCPGATCYAVIGGAHVYFDRDHVSRTYIKSLVPLVSRRFDAAVHG
ncbi:acyltransferase family protein [Sinomonas atrocyanea]|uniref:acyltransferase family protein n=1 Tax=Sinomonas atrocyanea TaxID=37927 RepID=UPI0027835879|nr:acyltransferase family protein [Sinomonas atrocyanea]MDQ0258384.1 peptidoglycan/LPS O-acetylase OafA/YrhL [Sinomonas atrocyanea]MDR6620653.1 peptidoglycan/LPS O-acetylase OafA/YrhL [Sinomonas atrocyanea]